jgi:hypothetical protein
MSLIAPPKAIYDDVDSAFTAIQAHVSEHGYAFCQHQIRSNRRVCACDRASKYNARGKDPNTDPSRQRNKTGWLLNEGRATPGSDI